MDNSAGNNSSSYYNPTMGYTCLFCGSFVYNGCLHSCVRSMPPAQNYPTIVADTQILTELKAIRELLKDIRLLLGDR